MKNSLPKLAFLLALVGITPAVSGIWPYGTTNAVTVSIRCTNGWNLVTCPLTKGTNLATSMFVRQVTNMTVWKLNPSTQTYSIITNLTATTWSGATNMTIEPGVGFWLLMPTNAVISFAGDVVQGTNSISTGTAYTLFGTMVPVSGRIKTDLGFPATQSDKVYTFAANGTFSTYTYMFGNWTPSEPTIAVGQGFAIDAVTNKTWSVVYEPNNIPDVPLVSEDPPSEISLPVDSTL
jgi:hypothetical protein